ncbi:hypothetical protein TWF506_010878 [Arthrobotrys conoides]|uniref:Uncharacterized protein n=1 Tax=Arthrobotrys conoides TaxID=74498 RepID=A0AAN8RT95_9PEZI
MGFVFYPPSFLEIVCKIPDAILILFVFLAVLPFWLVYISGLYLITCALGLLRGHPPNEKDLEKYDYSFQPVNNNKSLSI